MLKASRKRGEKVTQTCAPASRRAPCPTQLAPTAPQGSADDGPSPEPHPIEHGGRECPDLRLPDDL